LREIEGGVFAIRTSVAKRNVVYYSCKREVISDPWKKCSEYLFDASSDESVADTIASLCVSGILDGILKLNWGDLKTGLMRNKEKAGNWRRSILRDSSRNSLVWEVPKQSSVDSLEMEIEINGGWHFEHNIGGDKGLKGKEFSHAESLPESLLVTNNTVQGRESQGTVRSPVLRLRT
jgi:hypothetical protein